LIDTADGRIIRTFLGVSITNASLSNDGKTLATYDTYYYYSGGLRHTEEKLILWDVATGEILENILEKGFVWNNTTDLAFSSNGQFIGAALEDRSIQIWETTTGDLKNTLNDLVPNSWYYLNDFTLSFSPDSQLLLMAGANVIGVWGIQKGVLLRSAIIKTEEFVDIALSPDQNVLAVVEGPNVNLLQVSDGTLLRIQDQIQSNGSLAFSPDGASLMVSMFGGSAQLWPLSNQGIRKSFDLASDDVGGVAYSPDEQTVAIGKRYSGEVELYHVADGVLVRTLRLGTQGYVRRISYSPDGKYLAVSSSLRIRLFQLSDGKLLQTFNRGPNMAFSPDGNALAGGYSDKTISVWNVPDGNLLYLIKDRPDSVSSLAYSLDGRLLAAGFADGTIEVFSTTDGSLLLSWNEHLRTVSGLVFSPDGRYLISSSYDGTIRVWGLKP
jgi:WD40 repeat protein